MIKNMIQSSTKPVKCHNIGDMYHNLLKIYITISSLSQEIWTRFVVLFCCHLLLSDEITDIFTDSFTGVI